MSVPWRVEVARILSVREHGIHDLAVVPAPRTVGSLAVREVLAEGNRQRTDADHTVGLWKWKSGFVLEA